jgi:hypothetical protein
MPLTVGRIPPDLQHDMWVLARDLNVTMTVLAQLTSREYHTVRCAKRDVPLAHLHVDESGILQSIQIA